MAPTHRNESKYAKTYLTKIFKSMDKRRNFGYSSDAKLKTRNTLRSLNKKKQVPTHREQHLQQNFHNQLATQLA